MDNSKTQTSSGNAFVEESVNGQDPSKKRPSFSAITHSLEGVNNVLDSNSSPKSDTSNLLKCKYEFGTTSANVSETIPKDNNYCAKLKTCKDEKQRQNEEIVILESSSLSSETGSWESVFPSKIHAPNPQPDIKDNFKITPCFIDAATLVDDEITEIRKTNVNMQKNENLLVSHPIAFVNKLQRGSENESDDSLEQDDEISEDQDSRKDLSSIIFEMTPVTEDSLNTFENLIAAREKKSINTVTAEPDGESALENQKNDKPILSDEYIISNTPPTTMLYVKSCSSCVSGADVEENLLTCTYQSNDSNQSFNLIQPGPCNEDMNNVEILHSKIKNNIASESISTSSEISNICNSNVQSKSEYNNVAHSSRSTLPSQNAETNQVIREVNCEQTKSEDAEEMSYRKQKRYSESSPILSGGVSVEDHLPLAGSNVSSPMAKRKIENAPIVSGAYVPDKSILVNKSPKQSTCSAWIVDMSSCPSTNDKVALKSKPVDKSLKHVLSESKSSSDRDCSKSRSSVESESSEKSGHKYFIDLSNLPDPFPSKNEISQEKHSEKKNIFSMYIDLGEKSAVKEMPPRLMSMSARKHSDSSNPRSLDTKKLSAPRKAPTEKRNKSKSSESVVIAVSHNEDMSLKQNSESTTVRGKTNNNVKNKDSNGEILLKLDPESASVFVDTDLNAKYKNRESSLKQHPKSAVGLGKLNAENEDRDIEPKICHYKTKNKYSSGGNCLKLSSEIVSSETIKEKEDENEEIFVKLSDLDKPAPKIHSRSVNENWVSEIRSIPITRSIPDSTWINQGTMTKSTEIIHSFHSENALSLNRLFPHLKEFSRSIPGSLCSRTLSPLRAKLSNSAESDEQNLSDLSDMSSVQSSFCRSAIENNREISEIERHMYLISNCLSKLGEDLLHMFLEEIAPDVVIEVSGRRVKAHKCILSSRCQFFAGILSGGWVESAGNVIVIPTFSYDEVHFALCHIYCGISSIPAFINIVELSSVADMFGLDGLKEAIMHNLREKLCHNFHKPCEVCVIGVLECLALTSTYSLDELYEKCLKWITKYFYYFWVTKAFATLSKELLEKCLQQQVLSLAEENIIETICGCANILETLPDVRWAETVVRLCRRLMSEVAYFIGPILSRILRTLVTSPPKLSFVGYENLNKCIISAIELTPPSETCRVYQYLSELVKEIELNPILDLDIEHDTETILRHRFLIRYAEKWRLQCEKLFICSPSIIVMTDAFKDLPPELRKRLRELGCSMYESRPQSAWSLTFESKNYQPSNNLNDNRTSPSRSTKIDTVRMTFTPYSTKPRLQQSHSIEKQVNDLRKAKSRLANDPPKIRTTKAQEQRTRYNMTRAVLDCSQELPKKTGLSRSQNKSKFENTKPRYLELEPRHLKRNKETERKIVPNKLQNKLPSSSESSRNKSPVQQIVLRNSRMRSNNLVLDKMKKASKIGTKKPFSQTISEDTLASTTRPTSSEPSTESQKGSFSENVNNARYGTYTKKKHEYSKNNSCNMKERSERFCKVACVMDRFDIVKTKIPTYVNKGSQSSREFSTDRESPNQKLSASTNGQKPRDRCVSATLMCATKSSSAKMVIKIVNPKNSMKKRIITKGSDNTKEITKTDIPSMQRSGTFVREDKSFGEKPPN